MHFRQRSASVTDETRTPTVEVHDFQPSTSKQSRDEWYKEFVLATDKIPIVKKRNGLWKA
jgi:hypothetical protein